jgi:density-regulated protein DRP1
MEEGEAGEAPKTALPMPRTVVVAYCPACTMPYEYCCFGGDLAKCLPHILKNAPHVLDSPEKKKEAKAMNELIRSKLHKKEAGDKKEGASGPVATVAPAEGKESKEGKEGEAGATAAPGGEAKVAKAPEKKKEKKSAAKVVTVSRISRSKRKFLTLVSGLEAYNVAPKDACSLFKKKFACGVSQVKGADDIEIQGDVSFEVVEFIVETWPQVSKKVIKFGEDAKQSKK